MRSYPTNLILRDPADQRVTRVSVCAVITFLSIVIWWSAWIPLTLAGLVMIAYFSGYRVVIAEDSEDKPKRKNDEYEPISQDFI